MLKKLSIVVTLIILSLSLSALGFEEDSAGLSDSVKLSTKIYISPQQIDIKYSDKSDTTIYRLGQFSSGGTMLERDRPIIAIGEDELISSEDTIRGDIVILFGDVLIEGYVRGKITVLMGNVDISGSGNVEGDIYCLGDVILDSGVHIWGDIQASNLITPSRDSYFDFKGEFEEVEFSISDLQIFGPPAMIWMIIILVAVLIVVGLVTVIIPRPVARIRYQIEIGFMKNLLVGALILIALLPMWILIFVTVIGFPIAILVFPLVVIGAIVLGSIGFTQFAGYFMGQHSTLRYKGFLRTTLAGVVLLGAPFILSAFFSFVGIGLLAWPFHVIFITTQVLMICTGLGAVFFSRFGTLPKEINLLTEYNPTVKAVQPDSDENRAN